MCVCVSFRRKFSESGIDSTESTVNMAENECNFVSYLKLFEKEKFTHKAHQLQFMVVAWATFFTPFGYQFQIENVNFPMKILGFWQWVPDWQKPDENNDTLCKERKMQKKI